jgi:PST family polysaccharide transporter
MGNDALSAAPPDDLSGTGSLDATHSPADLRASTLRGGAQTVVAQLLKLGCQFGTTMVLGRLLAPSEFGLVAMVTAVTGILQIFKDGGLSTATVQSTRITDAQVSKLFWINLGLGAALAVGCAALAWPLAFFYREPRLVAVTAALSGSFLLGALAVQHEALLRRQMRFQALAVVELVSLACGSAVGVTLAWRGWGYWSLVGYQLTISLTNVVAVMLVLRWIPTWPRRETKVGSLLRFGGFLTGSELMNYAFRNTDNILIGWYWGAGPLGVYSKAYSLLMLAITQVNSPVARVAISALSRVQDEPARLRRYFLGGYTLVGAVNLPVMVALAVFAEEVIQLLLGDQWGESVGLFRLLAPAAISGALLNPFGWIFLSTGRPDRQMRFGLLWSALIIVAFAVGLPYGPAGVALGYSIMSCALALPLCFYAVQGTEIRVRDLFNSVKWPFLAALAGGAAGWTLKTTWPLSLPVAVRAMGGCAFVLGVYAVVLFLVFRQWDHFRNLLRQSRA